MMVFQSSAVTEILLGRDAGWQVQRRDNGGVTVNDILRKYTLPTLVGLAMAISAYAVSLPLFLWMAPVIGGLVLSIPVALLFSRPPVAQHTESIFATPEQNSPPRVLMRANELMTKAPSFNDNPVDELRKNDALLSAHMSTLIDQPLRGRGHVDPAFAVARLKIEDANSMAEAIGYLSRQELYAVLGNASLLGTLIRLPNSTLDSSIA